MICHAGLQALAIVALAGAMVLPPCLAETLFVAAIGVAALLATSLLPAGVAAVTLPAVAMATDPEPLAAGAASPRT